jgi:hypothetical protein
VLREIKKRVEENGKKKDGRCSSCFVFLKKETMTKILIAT